MAHDLVIRGGTVYDGSGGDGVVADVAVDGDRISVVGAAGEASDVIDATGLAVAPGFVNVLSHSYTSILRDPRSLGELVQGVTTQVFGEGHSMGPIPPGAEPTEQAPWRRLSEYLAHVEGTGASQNVCSLIGAATVRVYAMGHDRRPPTPQELDVMRGIVREEMQDGALGIGSALIYPPGSFAQTDELVAICSAAAETGGVYASHIRGEGATLLEATDELLDVCRRSGLRGEIWHMKSTGSPNWHLADAQIDRVEAARAAGEPVGADVYTYTASSTGLTPYIPDRFHEGGFDALLDRLDDDATRAEILGEVRAAAGSWRPSGEVLLLSMRSEELRHLQGRTLGEAAESLGLDPLEAVVELIRRDRSRVGVAYFSMSEDNLRKLIARPWVAFGSDGASMAPEGDFLRTLTHPRAYGNFARVLGRYVRDEHVITLPEAVRKLSALPAEQFGLDRRGRVSQGWFADLVVFDPATVADTATFHDPHRLATGVQHVLVNGTPALRDGKPTSHLPGRALYGAGRR